MHFTVAAGSSLSSYSQPGAPVHSSVLDIIVGQFDALILSADAYPGMPPALQTAMICLMMEGNQTQGDVWISQKEIIDTFDRVEKSLIGELADKHAATMHQYCQDARLNNTLASLLSDGIDAYCKASGRRVFISATEWNMSDLDRWTLSQPIAFDAPAKDYFYGTECLGRLTTRRIKNGELTEEQARQQYRELAPEVAKILGGALKQDGFLYAKAKKIEPYVFDGLLSKERMVMILGSDGLAISVFNTPALIDCIYEELITMNHALQLSSRQMGAVSRFKKLIDSPETLNQVLALTSIEIAVLDRLVPKFTEGSIQLKEAASFLKPLVEEMQLTNENAECESYWGGRPNSPQVTWAMNVLEGKILEKISGIPCPIFPQPVIPQPRPQVDNSSEGECSIQ